MKLSKEIKRIHDKGIFVNCQNIDEAKHFLTIADELGYKWGNGNSYKSNYNWKKYSENSCYDLFSGVVLFKSDITTGAEILNFSDIKKSVQPNISKENFCFLIQSIKEQLSFNRKVEDSMDILFEDFFGILETPLIEKTIDFLKEAFDDVENDWIGYFIFDLDFGRDETFYKEGSPVERKDGTKVPMRTSEDLYNYLVFER